MQRLIGNFTYAILLFSHLSFANSTVPSKAIEWTPTNINTANHYIIPLYKSLTESTQSLEFTFDNICVSSTEDGLVEDSTLILLQEKMRTVYINWANVQHIGFGPIAFLKRKERFQYWPDKHKVGGKQIRRLLTSNDIINLEQLEKKSVAIQGLPALEQLLFSQKKTLTVQQCLLAKMISQNLNNIAQQTYEAWALPDIHFADEFRHAQHGNGFYYSSEEIAGILLNSIATQLKIIEQLKLAYALPKANKKAKPRNLEAWRSQLSLQLVNKNLLSLEKFYQVAFEQHLQKSNKTLAINISKAFQKANKAFPQFTQTLYVMAKNKKVNKELLELNKDIKNLYLLLSLDMAKALKLSVGFNSLDGD